MAKRITIAADHGGFRFKEKIKTFLEKKGYKIDDVGTYSAGSCDYPAFAYEAARKISRKKAARGICVCKTGIGMAIVANKLPGVRAGVSLSKADAVSARRHNDTNVLVLAATKTTLKKALGIVKAWLGTRALKGRHARRVRQIVKIEKKVFRKGT